MLDALFKYEFLQNGVMAGILAAVVCGIMGVMIVEKKLVMMSGGIAHTAYGGVGFGYLMGFEPMIGATLFGVISALIIGALGRKGGREKDVIIALLWSMGMALGIIFISMMPTYPPDVNAYLFGNILTVTTGNLWVMGGLTLLVMAVVIIFWNDWEAFMFDDEFAAIGGMPTVFLEYLLLILIALTIVVLIRVVGIILVLALLTAPTATATLVTKGLKSRMLLAIVLGVLYSLVGLWVSYTFNLASGATIIILSGSIYFMGLSLQKIKERRG